METPTFLERVSSWYSASTQFFRSHMNIILDILAVSGGVIASAFCVYILVKIEANGVIGLLFYVVCIGFGILSVCNRVLERIISEKREMIGKLLEDHYKKFKELLETKQELSILRASIQAYLFPSSMRKNEKKKTRKTTKKV